MHSNAYAVNLKYKDLNGNLKNISDYNGKKLLIDAWASYCEPCKTTMADLHDVYITIGPDNINILSIDVSLDDDSDDINNFVSAVENTNNITINWDFGLDYNLEFVKQYNISFVPSLMLLSENGTLIKKWTGVTDPADIIHEINSTLEYTATNDGQLFNQLLHNVPFQILIVSLVVIFIYIKWNARKQKLIQTEDIP